MNTEERQNFKICTYNFYQHILIVLVQIAWWLRKSFVAKNSSSSVFAHNACYAKPSVGSCSCTSQRVIHHQKVCEHGLGVFCPRLSPRFFEERMNWPRRYLILFLGLSSMIMDLFYNWNSWQWTLKINSDIHLFLIFWYFNSGEVFLLYILSLHYCTIISSVHFLGTVLFISFIMLMHCSQY